MIKKYMTVSSEEVDAFGAAFALREAENKGTISPEVARELARRSSELSAALIDGRLLTIETDSEIVIIKLADKEPENQETAND